MKCTYCEHLESKVLDSRSGDDGSVIRRRRECLKCLRRFTTYETVETTPILVVKTDRTREHFDRNKIRGGIIRACEKRPISVEQIDTITDSIAKKVHLLLEQEIKTSDIGEMVMDELKKIDDVAYIRFASVYRQFTDVTTFVDFVQDRLKEIAPVKEKKSKKSS